MVFSDYEFTITDQIYDYQSLFISLGYHNSNHVLTLGEGLQLANYLESGGKIYMEGKKTWKDDPGTPIQPMFNIGYSGSVTIYDTITGIDTTFTAGTRLLNGTLYNLSFYNMVPIAPAFTILQDNNLLLSCAVAYDAGDYKTIGSIFDFGTLIDLNPSLTSDLMISYLEFFDIYMDPIGIEEQGSGEAGKQGGLVLWPNPAADRINISVAISQQVGQLGSWQLDKLRIEIYDIFGRIATAPILTSPASWREGEWMLDVSNLPPGIYILQMISEAGITGSAKFVKVSD